MRKLQELLDKEAKKGEKKGLSIKYKKTELMVVSKSDSHMC